MAGEDSHWFSAPEPLLPLPVEIQRRNGDRRRCARPLPAETLPIAVAVCPKKRTQNKRGSSTPAQLPSPIPPAGESYARCRTYVNGKKYAVPYSIDALDAKVADEDHEIIIVEMQTPARDEWINDTSLVGALVYNPTNKELSYVERECLRRAVADRMQVRRVPHRNVARGINTLCAPWPEVRSFLVLPLRLSDLELHPLIPACASSPPGNTC